LVKECGVVNSKNFFDKNIFATQLREKKFYDGRIFFGVVINGFSVVVVN